MIHLWLFTEDDTGGKKQPNTDLRLDKFLHVHSSEDNESFVELMEESERKRREKQAWLYVKEDEQQQVSRNTFSSSGWGFWLMGFGVVYPSQKLPEFDYHVIFMALFVKKFKNLVALWYCDINH